MEGIKDVNVTIKQYQETKDGKYFLELAELLSPLIRSCAKKLYYLEEEDSTQELHLALYEAIMSIKNTDNSTMCFSYLENAVRHRFFKLYHDSISAKEELDKRTLADNLEGFGLRRNDYENCLFKIDLERQLEKMNSKKRLIIILLNQEYTDYEIGMALGCSKQYINRVKKTLYKSYIQKDNS